MPNYKILSGINNPDDVKKLSTEELEELCNEIREKLVEVVSKNGGHLSPNLGVVELTVMLHNVFSTPKDDIVWDVGHQSYTHKMLTGRYDKIDTIRKKDGLSGFPKRSESDHDAFDVGHSSTSISAAYGIAKAKQLTNKPGHTIAVIGDGSFTGGLAFEGLNNSGRFKKNFIVILNDNKMSISQNVGAMARYLTSIRLKPTYIRMKQKTQNVLLKIPLIGEPIAQFLKGSKSRFKNLVYKSNLFEYLGYSYFGPVDGHNLEELKNALNTAKKVNGPVLIHVVTTKGKGYKFAEINPKEFHGIGKFNIGSGECIPAKTDFSIYFGSALASLAEKDKRICAITAAMKIGTGLQEFYSKYKERFFDVGIAEEHAVTFACGLASKGLIPVFAVYSTFIQRSYDQILHDAATQQLHIVLAIDRAGIVGEDGETHQGVFDVAMLNTIPNTTIYSPAYYKGVAKTLNNAIYKDENVVAVRYPRGCEGYRPSDYIEENDNYDIYGKEEGEKLIVTYGRLFGYACKAKENFLNEEKEVTILKLCKIKPIDINAIKFAKRFKKIYFFEEGILSGGIGETFSNMLNDLGYEGKIKITAIEDEFVYHAETKELLSDYYLDEKGMYNIVK